MQGTPLFVPAVIGDLALQASNNVTITGGSITGITDLAVADGGTGASTPAGARTSLELGTAATVNTGTTNGTIPVLTTNGRLPDSTAHQWAKVSDLTPINGFTALSTDWPNELWSHPSGLKLVRFGLVNTTANPSNTIALSWSGNIATQLWNTPVSTDGNGARVYVAGSDLVYDKGASAPSTITFCIGSLFFL